MDSTNQQPFQSSTPVSPLAFCAFCLRTNVEFYKQIVGCSREQRQCFRQILGYDFQLEIFAVCKPCWRVMELVQEFRLRCLKANRLVEWICQGNVLLWGSEEEEVSEKILATTDCIQMVLAEQMKQIERLGDIFEESKEGIEIDLTENQEKNRDPAEEVLESMIEVEEIKVELENKCSEREDYNLECQETLPVEMELECEKTQKESLDIYRCKICESSFTVFHLLVHHRLNHKESPPFQCWRHCSKAYLTVENRFRHEETCSKDALTCTLCNKPLENQTRLYEHYRLVHALIVKYPCPKCDKYFKKEEHLASHDRQVHHSENVSKEEVASKVSKLVLARLRQRNKAKSKKTAGTVKKLVDLGKGQPLKGLKLKSIQIINP